MISPRPALSSSSFFAFRPAAASPTTNPSPPPSPRLHAAPPPLSASFSPSASVVAPDHVAAAAAASFYDVLGLHAGASAREIKDAYRRLARAVHPDASPHPAAASSDDFIRVHAAYSTLSDPDKRADYDRRLLLLAAGRRRATPSLGRSPTFPARRRRTWETDQCCCIEGNDFD
uniref:J domain-containing protein n=1 Tax=Oryza glumipatula TaxID=40148 RepID=A0A0D9Z4J0_9ORYZ